MSHPEPGAVYGNWTVLRKAVSKREVKFTCRCTCGTERDVFFRNLRDGVSTSCGCQRGKLVGKANTKHGLWNTPTYKTWAGMIERCTLPSNGSYRDYGARGIKVCDRWVESVENFVADMGLRPDGKVLDRIDVNGNYEPNNCRWVTRAENNTNCRNTVYLTHGGRTQTLPQWAREMGTTLAVMHGRRDRGWTDSEIVTGVRND